MLLCPSRMLATSWPGPCTWCEAFFIYFFRTAKAAVCDSLVRPFHRAIRAALSSPCASQSVLTFVVSAMRADVRCSPEARAARSVPMTSLAHGPCALSHAGQPDCIVPWTHSERSANRTRGVQHVELRTRTRMWTHPFQIHTTLANIFVIHAAGSYLTWNISGPDRDRADAHMWAMRETRHGPRTRRRSNPARLPN